MPGIDVQGITRWMRRRLHFTTVRGASVWTQGGQPLCKSHCFLPLSVCISPVIALNVDQHLKTQEDTVLLGTAFDRSLLLRVVWTGITFSGCQYWMLPSAFLPLLAISFLRQWAFLFSSLFKEPRMMLASVALALRYFKAKKQPTKQKKKH